jgi:hypothetical protein
MCDIIKTGGEEMIHELEKMISSKDFDIEKAELLIKQIDVPEHYELMFEERFIEPLPARCGKCVYETHCPGRNTDINQTCHNYKRDAPDGGYYG